MAKLKGKEKAEFLRRMARGRNKKHGGARKRKHKHTEKKHMAKKRHHAKHKKSTRRRHHAGLGSVGKWLPDQHKLVGMGAAFAYGKVEAAASKDAAHFINKVPVIIGQLGRAGNLGAILWLGGVALRQPIVKSVASGVLHVAAYQNGRTPAAFTKDAPDFKMSGTRPGRGRDEMLVEQYLNQR